MDSVNASMLRVAGWCAYISGGVSIFGIIFLVLFFSGLGDHFGPMNDVAVIFQYALMLPMAVILWLYLHPDDEQQAQTSYMLGLVGMVMVIALQTLLVADMIPFGIYIFIVSAGFIVATVWFVMNGRIGRAANKLPNEMVLDVLAGLYIGYPIWAFRLGRRLLAQAG